MTSAFANRLSNLAISALELTAKSTPHEVPRQHTFIEEMLLNFDGVSRVST